MNKKAIKNFAIWARNTLIKDTMYKARLLGVSAEGIQEPLPNSTKDMQFFDVGTDTPYSISGSAVSQRRSFVTALRQKAAQSEYEKAYRAMMEEVAYTWFNRLIAIRFMEVNGYLPSGIRVLSSESGKWEPDIVTTPFEADLPFTEEEEIEISRLKRENQSDTVFQLLFIKQCNALHDILPQLFETTADYTELLLNISITDQDGVVCRLIHDIDEADFDVSRGGQVEIIGWLYQYYNTELKDETSKLLKKNVKVTKERLPSATQLFTPDWIVRYMVENSLGRMWIQGHMESPSQEEAMAKEFGWQYYIPEAAQEPDVEAKLQDIRKEYSKLRPEDLTVIDPCMGSGHILVYAFDVLMQIYRVNGYSDRDAAELILERNLYGLDIDDRAFQLAYFSVLMKARQYSRRVLTHHPRIHLCAIAESSSLQKWSDLSGHDFAVEQLDLDSQFIDMADYLIDTFRDAKEYGSLLRVERRDYSDLLDYIRRIQDEGGNLLMEAWINDIAKHMPKLIEQADLLSCHYDVVVTNPPYMGSSDMNASLSNYVKNNFKEYKSDLFSACMVRFTEMTKRLGYLGFLSPYVWMFISSYEKLRQYFIQEKTIQTLIQFEYSAFEEATVPICTFVLQNSCIPKKGTYLCLTEYRGGMEVQRQKALEAIATHDPKLYFETSADNFSKIPGSPISYWASNNILDVFRHVLLNEVAKPRHGLATSDNNRFLRIWFEINVSKASLFEKCNMKMKWFPINKGGSYRKWYGNLEWVINYENDGKELKDFAISIYKCSSRTIQNTQFYFKEGLTWSALTSRKFSVRWTDKGAIFGSGGYYAFVNKHYLKYILALLNSNVIALLIAAVSQTLNYEVGHIKSLPVILDEDSIVKINQLTDECIDISKQDWDSFETSWDFVHHPLVDLAVFQSTKATLSQQYVVYKAACETRFETLKNNEEELNRIFIDIYGLQDELTSDVADKDVTVARVYDTKEDIPPSMKGNKYVLTKRDVVKSLLSYAVGCLFGRYSLDVDGLAYAGGDWDASKYATFIPDMDNVIPITDTEYFKDDIVGLFCAWLKKVYGADTLEENLSFIADALNGKSVTSRDVIRSYFLKEFYKDHCKTYKKRPIYWFFDSGKENGFKALIYLHRYDADTIGKVRVEYLHKMERIYENETARMQDIIDHTDSAREKTRATKTKEKLQKQRKECRDYDEKLAHLAADRIAIDLDDGVKVNYEKIQTARDGKKYQILAKI